MQKTVSILYYVIVIYKYSNNDQSNAFKHQMIKPTTFTIFQYFEELNLKYNDINEFIIYNQNTIKIVINKKK